MNITHISVVNWKCFDKKEFNFTKQNIINFKNGTGKSSIFQAIIYGIYGKRPAGFNLNNIRLNDSEDCIVRVDFDYTDHDNHKHKVLIKRQFGKNSIVLIKEDGNIVATSSNEAFIFTNNIAPYDIVSVLWAARTLSSSDILKPEFLINSLFNYIFKDPKLIQSLLKKDMFAENKIIKSIKLQIGNLKPDEDKLKEIELEIQNIRNKIKKKTSNSDMVINKARQTEVAYNKLKDFNIITQIPLDTCNDYIRLLGNNDIDIFKTNITNKLALELSKSTSVITNIPIRSLKLILTESQKESKCLICGEEWHNKSNDLINKVIKEGGVDENLINRLRNNLLLLKFNMIDIKANIELNKLKNIVSSCKNWSDIISEYDKDNIQMWNNLENLEKEKSKIDKQIEIYKNLLIEEKKLNNLKINIDIVSSYIQKASTFYSMTMTEKASNILCELNSRYEQLFLDDGEYKISVIDENMNCINILSAIQLSSGEKTLIGISLILAAHNLFFNELPLLFDESFANLDHENIISLKKRFKKNNMQTFVITHDSTWLE